MCPLREIRLQHELATRTKQFFLQLVKSGYCEMSDARKLFFNGYIYFCKVNRNLVPRFFARHSQKLREWGLRSYLSRQLRTQFLISWRD